jgi:hypothetical protein
MKKEEVKDYIRTANREELKELQTVFNTAAKILREETKGQFKVGDLVNINHNKVSGNKEFRIIKINNKNIKVTSTSSGRIPNVFENYTVSPTFLEKI